MRTLAASVLWVACASICLAATHAGNGTQCKKLPYDFCCEVGTVCDCDKAIDAPGQCVPHSYDFCCGIGNLCNCSIPPLLSDAQGAASTVGGEGWLHDEKTKDQAMARASMEPILAKRVQVNLDLPPKERWVEIGKEFKDKAPAVIAYFEQYIPKWLLPILEPIAGDLASYFPADFAAEMEGVAPAMGLKVGDVVVMNLIYQIEHIGITCNASNNTGPVPNCPPSKNHTPGLDAPGLCTSIMSMSGGGDMFHGRNLDWNIPAALRPLMVDVDYTRNGSVLFTASQPVGFSGIMHGVRHDGWSFSLNARDKGGKVLINLVQALLRKSVTPTQHARMVMETQATWDGAVTALSSGSLINAAYFNTAGSKAGEAAVVSRGRDKAVDVWKLDPAEKKTPFFLAQTNYDHWQPVPSFDDRRTPAIAHMKALGQPAVGFDGMLSVMKMWPTFNHHTDFTIVFSPTNASSYQTLIWPSA